MAGGDPDKMVLFDTKGSPAQGPRRRQGRHALLPQVGAVRADQPGPRRRRSKRRCKGADVLIALRKPGPDTVKQDVDPQHGDRSRSCSPARTRCRRSIPTRPRKPGAYIVATGRGDFPNQVNNSIGFPGHPQGRAAGAGPEDHRRDGHRRGVLGGELRGEEGDHPDYIMPTMDETEVFAEEAADVAMQAIKNGVARISSIATRSTTRRSHDINEARAAIDLLMKNDFIKTPGIAMLEDAVQKAVGRSRSRRAAAPGPRPLFYAWFAR